MTVTVENRFNRFAGLTLFLLLLNLWVPLVLLIPGLTDQFVSVVVIIGGLICCMFFVLAVLGVCFKFVPPIRKILAWFYIVAFLAIIFYVALYPHSVEMMTGRRLNL